MDVPLMINGQPTSFEKLASPIARVIPAPINVLPTVHSMPLQSTSSTAAVVTLSERPQLIKVAHSPLPASSASPSNSILDWHFVPAGSSPIVSPIILEQQATKLEQKINSSPILDNRSSYSPHQAPLSGGRLDQLNTLHSQPNPSSVRLGQPNPSSIWVGQSNPHHSQPNPSSVKLGQPNSSSARLGQPNPSSIWLGQSNPSSIWLGQPNSSSVRLGQPNSSSVRLGQPNPSSVRLGQSNPHHSQPNPSSVKSGQPNPSSIWLGQSNPHHNQPNSSSVRSGQSNPSSVRLGQSNPSSVRLGQPNSSSVRLGQPNSSSARLGQPNSSSDSLNILRVPSSRHQQTRPLDGHRQDVAGNTSSPILRTPPVQTPHSVPRTQSEGSRRLLTPQSIRSTANVVSQPGQNNSENQQTRPVMVTQHPASTQSNQQIPLRLPVKSPLPPYARIASPQQTGQSTRSVTTNNWEHVPSPTPPVAKPPVTEVSTSSELPPWHLILNKDFRFDILNDGQALILHEMMRVKYGDLRHSHGKVYPVPDFPAQSDLQSIVALYRQTCHSIAIRLGVYQYKIYMCIAYGVTQIVLARFLPPSIDMRGYMEYQANMLPEQELDLIELSELGSLQLSGGYHPLVRLAFTAGINIIIFIVLKWVTGKIGVDMVSLIITNLRKALETPAGMSIMDNAKILGFELPSAVGAAANVVQSFVAKPAPQREEPPQKPVPPRRRAPIFSEE